jgi:type I restriction enzyme, S subunit
MSWDKMKLDDILIRKRESIKVKPNKEYKLVTIKLHHKGVALRETKRGSEIKSNMSKVRVGDFVLSGIDARNGAFGIVPDELDNAIISNDFWCLVPNEKIIKKEFLLFITSTPYFDFICNQSSDGTTQRIRLQKEKFFNYEIAVPPIEEQDKILRKLSTNKEVTELLESEHSTQLDILKRLRQQILQDAVQGKLIQQDPNDEPAIKLLERITAEKEPLIREKKIRKEKPLPEIKSEEIPFEIPENWVWCRLAEIGAINPRNHISDDLDVSFIPMTMISERFGKQPDYIIRKWKDIKSGFTHFANQDVAIAKITPCFENSKACVFKNLINKFGAGTTELHVFRSHSDSISSEYIYVNLKTTKFLVNGERIMRGVAGQQRVPTDYLREYLIPLPPALEQHRIVTKIERLMKLCDELEQSIMQNQKYTQELLQVALKEALEPKD